MFISYFGNLIVSYVNKIIFLKMYMDRYVIYREIDNGYYKYIIWWVDLGFLYVYCYLF